MLSAVEINLIYPLNIATTTQQGKIFWLPFADSHVVNKALLFNLPKRAAILCSTFALTHFATKTQSVKSLQDSSDSEGEEASIRKPENFNAVQQRGEKSSWNALVFYLK